MTADTIEAPAQPDATSTKPAKRAKPATLDLVTGHCVNEHHGSCRGSGPNGAGSTWYCTCECHVEHPTCRDCGARDVEVTLEGTCIDVEGCATTQQVRTASNPVHKTIREALNHAAQAAFIKSEQDAQKRARERAAAPSSPNGGPKASPQPRPARVARPAPTPQRCHDGCGGTTKGGKFLAGHDAKLKGVLVKAARQTPPESGKPATKADAIRAMAELIARGWPRKHVDAKITEQAEQLVDQHGIDRLIDLAVARRYGDK
jgi:hypothetical protein